MKQYDITQSALYHLKSIDRLAQLLHFETDVLQNLESTLKNKPASYYHVFKVGEGNGREVQHPFQPQIKLAQSRVKLLLSQIIPPAYLQSGCKGKSYVDNAKEHRDSAQVLTMDIRGFYKNTRDEAVFQFFIHKLGMAHDIAHLMTNICTYGTQSERRRKIPTGSVLSQQLAYWAYSDMFDKIDSLARSVGAKFTLYVDDMTFSSMNCFSIDFHKKVQEILATRWLGFKPTKLQRANQSQRKHITGCIITPDHKVVVPNKLRKKVVDALKIALNTMSPTPKDIQRALGLINSCRQIEPGIFETSIRQLKAKQKKLLARA